MAKRKAIMKNIIYELDDDIEISSEDEVSGPKVTPLEPQRKDKSPEIIPISEPNGAEVLSVDSTDDSVCLIDSPNPKVNGGKTTAESIVTIDSPDLTKTCDTNSQDESDYVTQNTSDGNKTVSNDDIEDDSPSLCAAGCENRTPLVTMRFKNSKLSSSLKIQVKEFIINLLKQQQGDLAESDNDSDHEVDIWPEDLIEDCIEEKKQQAEENQDVDDSLFFMDTAPCDNLATDIPKYRQNSHLMTNTQEDEVSPPKIFKRTPQCFNCDGEHWLRDCKKPRNHSRIADKRQQTTKVGRYHIEDDQKYGHLIPGRISGALRYALGLKRNELPLHIYRMRMLGYPPGWLEEARISHSGISMFDSTGTAIMDPEDEEGEICEAGSKDKFDIKKILDFPGFNVPASSRYVEEAYLYGLPPISEQDSKIAMLQMLAPNAMKAYKRKKLTFFPSSINNSLKEGQAEMDLDSGDEEAVFPSVPPLPDEAPPPLPPPPEQPPPPPASPPPPPPDEAANIPIPEDSLIIIDECYDKDEKSASGRNSPSLEDLEKKKQDLMDALENNVSVIGPDDVSVSDTNAVVMDESDKVQEANDESEEKKIETNGEDKAGDVEIVLKDEATSAVRVECDGKDVKDDVKDTAISETVNNPEASVSTPEAKTGHVKTTSFGTPVLNIASPFTKIPSDDKFSKQICDVINFENLPNSTGKYKQICSLLKKVKTEVDRIQDS